MISEAAEKFLKKMEIERAAEAGDWDKVPKFRCACGQEIWTAADPAHFVCSKCFGAFRPVSNNV